MPRPYLHPLVLFMQFVQAAGWLLVAAGAGLLFGFDVISTFLPRIPVALGLIVAGGVLVWAETQI